MSRGPQRLGFMGMAMVALFGCGAEEESPYEWIRGRVEAPASVDLSMASVLRCRDDRWEVEQAPAIALEAADSPAVAKYLREHVQDEASAPVEADRTFSIRVPRGQNVDLQVALLRDVALCEGRSPIGATSSFRIVVNCPVRTCVVGVVQGHEGAVNGVRAGMGDVVIRMQPVRVVPTTARAEHIDSRPVVGTVVRWRSYGDWACAETDANGMADLGFLPQREGTLTAAVKGAVAEGTVAGRARATPGADPLRVALRVGVPVRVRLDGPHPPIRLLSILDLGANAGMTYAWKPDESGTSVVFAEPEWSDIDITAWDEASQTFAARAQARLKDGLTVTLKVRR